MTEISGDLPIVTITLDDYLEAGVLVPYNDATEHERLGGRSVGFLTRDAWELISEACRATATPVDDAVITEAVRELANRAEDAAGLALEAITDLSAPERAVLTSGSDAYFVVPASGTLPTMVFKSLRVQPTWAVLAIHHEV